MSFHPNNLHPALSVDPTLASSSSSRRHTDGPPTKRTRPLSPEPSSSHPRLPSMAPVRQSNINSLLRLQSPSAETSPGAHPQTALCAPPPPSSVPPPFNFESRSTQTQPRTRQQQPPHTSPRTITPPTAQPTTAHPRNFDVLDWSRAYSSCQRYFLDHGQHEAGTQAMAALINILLPYQWRQTPVYNSTPQHAPDDERGQTSTPPEPQGPGWYFPDATSSQQSSTAAHAHTAFVSLIPYIRRMLITGYAVTPVLYGVFGSDYKAGILPLVEVERRNYLFTAKSVGWAGTKREYHLPGGQDVPFMNPLGGVNRQEVENAEAQWGSWMRVMEDWEVTQVAPSQEQDVGEESREPATDDGTRPQRRRMRRPREDVSAAGVKRGREDS